MTSNLAVNPTDAGRRATGVARPILPLDIRLARCSSRRLGIPGPRDRLGHRRRVPRSKPAQTRDKTGSLLRQRRERPGNSTATGRSRRSTKNHTVGSNVADGGLAQDPPRRLGERLGYVRGTNQHGTATGGSTRGLLMRSLRDKQEVDQAAGPFEGHLQDLSGGANRPT